MKDSDLAPWLVVPFGELDEVPKWLEREGRAKCLREQSKQLRTLVKQRDSITALAENPNLSAEDRQRFASVFDSTLARLYRTHTVMSWMHFRV